MELGTPRPILFQTASSLQFPICLFTVAVHEHIAQFRAIGVSWLKLDEAMNVRLQGTGFNDLRDFFQSQASASQGSILALHFLIPAFKQT